MLTLRLNKDLESALELAATRAGVSKSQLVRQCLERYLADTEPANLAWELGKDLFGAHGSGRGDLSRRRKELVREKIHARRGRR
jgi:predicted DNA-binding protein